jgi:hypothetical protein
MRLMAVQGTPAAHHAFCLSTSKQPSVPQCLNKASLEVVIWHIPILTIKQQGQALQYPPGC